MIGILIGLGIVFLLIAGVFFYLNIHSPVQTFIPIIAGPIGIIFLLIGLGGLIL